MQEALLAPLAAWQNFYVIIGIHNAWDNVTYTAIELSRPQNKSQG